MFELMFTLWFTVRHLQVHLLTQHQITDLKLKRRDILRACARRPAQRRRPLWVSSTIVHLFASIYEAWPFCRTCEYSACVITLWGVLSHAAQRNTAMNHYQSTSSKDHWVMLTTKTILCDLSTGDNIRIRGSRLWQPKGTYSWSCIIQYCIIMIIE